MMTTLPRNRILVLVPILAFYTLYLIIRIRMTKEDLQSPQLKEDIQKSIFIINRSSGSSGWLKDLYLSGDYDAMVNYEAVIIETNQELIQQGKEPLYVVYPKNGLTISDNTFAM